MKLSKTGFIQYLNCPKSLWLSLHKPDIYPKGEFSDYARKLTKEGYEVEGYVKQLFQSQSDAALYDFQRVFETAEGMLARADVVRQNEGGTINLYEVKSSTSVKDNNPHNQLKDAAFQTIAAEANGAMVDRIFIVHLNGTYVRKGAVDPQQLLTIADETRRVRDLIDETRDQISGALALLAEEQIDESACSCLQLGKKKHCDSFDYFNPDIPKPSIYDLPRLHKNKIIQFSKEGRFALDQIGQGEVSANQALVLSAAQNGAPIINADVLAEFCAQAQYPFYFLDYETYASAIPIIDGVRPQSQLPFQFSLHVKRTPDDVTLAHHEYLAEAPLLPLAFIEELERRIGPRGSLISWHKSFENTRNREMGDLYPDKAEFLSDISARTLDLEDVFKTGYVDIRFGGSTSIKKVLPVLAPDLTYEGMDIAGGTEAMDGWMKFIDQPHGAERERLRSALLEYCKLDTYAMVRIFEEIEKLI
ncbi:DUF2779 domain-containing protein [Ruegeria sp. HKCCA5929]|uniref:DUF2779 domain-containing protein n=1 Tax=Ruegeria sp. HKCCA5929 TaxID=2682988 RepID=UPI001488BEFA|nr:DUF2779 domain-containing protein [Ruegeria sp. HKCCA5929]